MRCRICNKPLTPLNTRAGKPWIDLCDICTAPDTKYYYWAHQASMAMHELFTLRKKYESVQVDLRRAIYVINGQMHFQLKRKATLLESSITRYQKRIDAHCRKAVSIYQSK